ncbi:OLC1v1017454C1 [Oldenlandia corymbosa var. corymbosa]|uniref:OLC1v1017454C1 n=1 Tax=Oldenlandia corymbosa var. corymbosa TaxID=529605 RepID=A0AAV1E9I2_OLDCO|nr:OLC1v1017454C1 [Oldenlandia corymbosa var. corymbosa]
MEHFQNQDLLEYVVDEYTDFEDNPFDDVRDFPKSGGSFDEDDDLDSDFEDDFELSKAKTDTSAMEARNGKDIQGIPWERMNYTRDKYRETRLKQYKNYENLSRSREDLEKECKEVEKGHNFYDFQFNTRLVKSTIVHFQV